MKSVLFTILLFAIPLLSTAQVSPPAAAPEKHDTIYGLAMVLDTNTVFRAPKNSTLPGDWKFEAELVEVNELTTAIWPAYSVATYFLIADALGNTKPKVKSVYYYRIDDGTQIPITRIFQFKQQ